MGTYRHHYQVYARPAASATTVRKWIDKVNLMIVSPTQAEIPGTLVDLNVIGELMGAFNRDKGVPRLILLFSPTWPPCVEGARWVQTEILAANPSADLRVYAIWFNMYPGDERSKWDAALITDPRVTFFWDEAAIVGRRLVEDNVVAYSYEILWDAYLLFGPDAEWDAVLPPPLSWGDPVYHRKQELKDAILPLLRG